MIGNPGHKFIMLALCLFLIGCEQRMGNQPKIDTFESAAEITGSGLPMEPPENTVAFVSADADNLPVNEPQYDADSLRRGMERYEIFCAPCHGISGKGNGPVVQHGFPAPRPLHEADLRLKSDDFFYEVIANGYGVMFPLADRIPVTDRWLIVAYVRALQLSFHAELENYPEIVERMESAQP